MGDIEFDGTLSIPSVTVKFEELIVSQCLTDRIRTNLCEVEILIALVHVGNFELYHRLDEKDKTNRLKIFTFVKIFSLMNAASGAPVISTVFRVSPSRVTRKVTLSPGLPRVTLVAGYE